MTKEKIRKQKAITLIALIITIIILLILAGVAISTLGGEEGLISKVKLAKQNQIEADMKEQLILSLQELQIEKVGQATLDDVTQEWLDITIKDYNCSITTDATISGKIVIMEKDGIVGKYLIDEKLNITEIENDGSNIDFSYEVGEREGNKVKILIKAQNKEIGINKIEFPEADKDTLNCGGTKDEIGIDYEVELGVEYKFNIILKDGTSEEKTILITDYYYTITKKLGEGISIDNTSIKAAYNKPYQAVLTTGNDYILETLTVTMDGVDVTSTVADKTTGTINIEKVTGDIEIVATARKLEIVTTEPIIGTTNPPTTSVADNSQTRETPLYINFTATLEGQNCTITLKDDNTKTVPYEITKNGTYTFVVTGTYNGKTITKEIEVVVNKYQSMGGFVQYDAGEWTKEEIEELNSKQLYVLNSEKAQNKTFRLENPTDDKALNFTFGGFTYKGDTENASLINDGTIITSRNQSVAPQSGVGTPKYDGWQILESNVRDGKTYVTKLVHAGSSENFVYHYTTSNDNKRAEYLLSGGVQPTYKTLKSGKAINPRKWDMYKDKNLEAEGMIEDVHAMTYDEALKITGLRNTGAHYWLASANTNSDIFVHGVNSDGRSSGGREHCYGVRPVVSLTSGVYITGGDGTEANPYVLGKD